MRELMGTTVTLPAAANMPADECDVIEEGDGYVMTRTCVPGGCRYEVALDEGAPDSAFGYALTLLPHGAVFLGTDALNAEACGWDRLMVWWGPPLD